MMQAWVSILYICFKNNESCNITDKKDWFYVKKKNKKFCTKFFSLISEKTNFKQ